MGNYTEVDFLFLPTPFAAMKFNYSKLKDGGSFCDFRSVGCSTDLSFLRLNSTSRFPVGGRQFEVAGAKSLAVEVASAKTVGGPKPTSVPLRISRKFAYQTKRNEIPDRSVKAAQKDAPRSLEFPIYDQLWER